MTDRDYAQIVSNMLTSEWGRIGARDHLSLHLINGERLVAKLFDTNRDVTTLEATNGDQFTIPTRAICYYRWVECSDEFAKVKCPSCDTIFRVSTLNGKEDQ